jgi:ribonuclease E
MAKKMLIDSTQAEETRVAVLDGNRLDELDFEIASKKQLKGNIYLAKVTRVEPSLQAAFIDYGGNRHGFLAFSEIHPDYYRIPIADREKLLALEAEDFDDEDEDILEQPPHLDEGDVADLPPLGELVEPVGEPALLSGELPPEAEAGAETAPLPIEGGESIAELPEATTPVDEFSEEDAVARRRAKRRAAILRQYKIQEVIKRNQIMLIQVVKEERGNKGAALTTYLSLAGRYCVLMPNTGRGGGVSRKITNPEDRRRMKALIDQLTVPDGMSVILRTAGMERAHQDIQRDLDYLMRLWDGIREDTLKATAPSLVHEEASLIRRAIRDLYSRDIARVEVEGEAGYRMAKEFMRMLVPAAVRKVQHYRDPAVPLFVRHRLETQIEALYNSTVTLKSGGYIVINPTEALVAIDVNSGRSTRERNIEETALRTNLEAADEVARQLRLRDLAGLIVVDFIDMEDARHNMQVERRMREAMKNDRARVQIGRISMFGLLELSRQRLHPSLTETNFAACSHCNGTGNLRNTESAALHILRSVEEEGLQQKASELAVNVASEVSLYILNHKRAALADIEHRYGIKVFIHGDDALKVAEFKIERTKARVSGEFTFPEPPPPEPEDPVDLAAGEEEETPIEKSGEGESGESDAGESGEGRRSRWPRGGRSRGPSRTRYRERTPAEVGEQPTLPDGVELQPPGLSHEGQIIQNGEGELVAATADGTGERNGRRRGRRGGRGRFRERSGTGGQPYPADAPQPSLAGFDDGVILTSADLPVPPDVNGNTGPREEGQPPREGRNGHRGGRSRGRYRGNRGEGNNNERTPRGEALPDVPREARMSSDIKIVSEFRGRDPELNRSPQNSAPVNVNPPADKPKGGWWKRLIGSE